MSFVISLGLSCVNDPESCGVLGLSDKEARLLLLTKGCFDDSALFDGDDDTVKPAFLVELAVVLLVVLDVHVSVLILRVYLDGFTILCTDPLAIDR